MKKSILLLALIFLSVISYSQELKGVYLGSYTKIVTPRHTTLVGKDYSLSTVNLKNGKCVMVIAIPTYSGDYSLRQVKLDEITDLVNALEAKYKVKFDFFPKEEGEEHLGWIVAESEKFTIQINVSEYDEYSEKYQIGVSLRDIKLEELWKLEKQQDL